MRRTYGDQLDSAREPPPERYLPTIEERGEPARPPVVRNLQLSEDVGGSSSSADSRKRVTAPVYNVINACSDSDYFKIMALIFQKVFRE